MSTPQDDIGAAIVAVMEASPFSDYLGAVGYGTMQKDVGKDSTGKALVSPSDATDLEAYSDSVRRQYTYIVSVRLSNRAMAPAYTQLQRDMTNVFNASSRTLQAAFTDTSTKVHGPTLRAATEIIDPQEPDGDSQTTDFQVTVTVWEATT